jgi:O-antigen ligase
MIKLMAQRVALPAWLLLCLVLGGASAAGFLANACLQILALGLILWLLHTDSMTALSVPSRRFVAIIAGAATYLTATLIPVPSGIWMLFGNRDFVASGFILVGDPVPWLPISMTPDRTIAALLSLLPPLATFLLAIRADLVARQHTLVVLIAAILASIIFGVMQVVAGFHSDLYLYEGTSRGGATAFFANRNHLATLCLMGMPFATALLVQAKPSSSRSARTGQLVLAAGALAFLGVGALVVQSLAGWLLLLPTLLGCLLIFRFGRRGTRLQWLAAIGGAALAVALLAALFAPFTAVDIDRTVGELQPLERQQIMRNTARAIGDHLPMGAGFGSFQQIYPRYEDREQITPGYANRAHNDYLELALEGGLPGVALLGALMWWWVRQSVRAWSGTAKAGHFARAASIAILILLAHSLVDYPVRTAAIACVAALACAMLCVPYELSSSRLSSSRLVSGDGRRRMIDMGANPKLVATQHQSPLSST